MQGFRRGSELKAHICEYFFLSPKMKRMSFYVTVTPEPILLVVDVGYVICFSVCIDGLLFLLLVVVGIPEHGKISQAKSIYLCPLYVC